jgi:hypothetical protein
MCELIRSISNAHKLVHLQLKQVKHFNQCMHDLYIATRNHATLKRLEISDNSLSDYEYVIKIIEENTVIDHLDVRNNYINTGIVDQIVKGLEKNLSV